MLILWLDILVGAMHTYVRRRHSVVVQFYHAEGTLPMLRVINSWMRRLPHLFCVVAALFMHAFGMQFIAIPHCPGCSARN